MEQAKDVLTPIVARRTLLPASVVLAVQRVRQTWKLLSLVGLGMLASVMLVCAAPLYAQVAMTAGLRSALSSYGQNTDIIVRGTAFGPSTNSIESQTASFDQAFSNNLGPYLRPTQFSLQP